VEVQYTINIIVASLKKKLLPVGDLYL